MGTCLGESKLSLLLEQRESIVGRNPKAASQSSTDDKVREKPPLAQIIDA